MAEEEMDEILLRSGSNKSINEAKYDYVLNVSQFRSFNQNDDHGLCNLRLICLLLLLLVFLFLIFFFVVFS